MINTVLVVNLRLAAREQSRRGAAKGEEVYSVL